MKIRKLLVATDLSEAADGALRKADELARKTGAELLVCHVLPDLFRTNLLFPQFNQELNEQMPAMREAAADSVARRVTDITGRSEADFTLILEDGAAHAAIIEAAESSGADLLIVATQGLTGLSRVFLGSVAELVVRYASCSVLVTRPSPKTTRVLAATDFSDPSVPAITAGAEWASLLGGELTVAHAIDTVPGGVVAPFPYMSVLPIPPPSEVDRLRALTDEHIAAVAQKAGIEAKRLVLDGLAAPAVVRAAEEIEAELVVVGTAGRTGLKRVALGSVAELVVRQAPCSVLVVRLRPRSA